MAGAVMNKIWDFLGMESAEEDEEIEDRAYDYEYEEEEEEQEVEGINRLFGRKSKVVNMPQTREYKNGNITTNYF